jgi:hypothetical protein
MKYFILALSILFICGCSDRVAIKKTIESDIKYQYVVPKNSNYVEPWSFEGYKVPNWVFDSTLNGKYEGGMGACTLRGKTLAEAKEIAYKQAVNEIATARSFKIKSSTKEYKTGDGVIDYFDSTIKIEVDSNVSDAKIVDEWTHASTQDYYIWVVVQ